MLGDKFHGMSKPICSEEKKKKKKEKYLKLSSAELLPSMQSVIGKIYLVSLHCIQTCGNFKCNLNLLKVFTLQVTL